MARTVNDSHIKLVTNYIKNTVYPFQRKVKAMINLKLSVNIDSRSSLRAKVTRAIVHNPAKIYKFVLMPTGRREESSEGLDLLAIRRER